ncbi:MAG: hypothetical protein HOW73_16035 [Polyangiaceae bacterium]|nr:hypothetical protein [Polyangiaceae bacterium]
MNKSVVVWAALGGLSWTASEYVIHRFIGHGKSRHMPDKLLQRLTPKGFMAAFNAEHRAHHTDTTYFAASSHKAGAAAVAIPALTAVLAPILGVRRACAFASGYSVAYGAYEVAHRLVHVAAPRTRYGRWMRKHHLDHHHRTPRANHGVTSALWDHVFGTNQPAERVRIPRRAAPAWMVDESGQVRAEFAGDYEIIAERQRHAAKGEPEADPMVVS